jgi:hypothetical protein
MKIIKPNIMMSTAISMGDLGTGGEVLIRRNFQCAGRELERR